MISTEELWGYFCSKNIGICRNFLLVEWPVLFPNAGRGAASKVSKTCLDPQKLTQDKRQMCWNRFLHMRRACTFLTILLVPKCTNVTVNYHGRHTGRKTEDKCRDVLEILKEMRRIASMRRIQQFVLIGDFNITTSWNRRWLPMLQWISFAGSASWEISLSQLQDPLRNLRDQYANRNCVESQRIDTTSTLSLSQCRQPGGALWHFGPSMRQHRVAELWASQYVMN